MADMQKGTDAGLPAADAQQFIDKLVRGSRQPVTRFGHAGFAAAAAEEGDGGPTTIACMVTHGMGQQVPFETAASIAEAFGRGRQASAVRPNRVQLTPNGELLMRMEMTFPATDSAPETTLHVYEGYWAPLTEGEITYAQSLKFLFSGAWEGVKSYRVRKEFNRWIFGQFWPLPIKRHTFGALLVVVVLLLIAVALAAVGAAVAGKLWQALTQVEGTTFRALLGAVWRILSRTWYLAPVALVGWLYARVLHFVLIEYAGDVAIYVSAHRVSEFEQIRTAIQERVLAVGKQIFLAKRSDGGAARPLYDGVIFAGHSLGSVITYDLLNALIMWDVDGCNGKHAVVQRVRRLVTFGSPLDKTAFLFRTQNTDDHHYREAMAGLMQPMVLSYALRPFPWVNLYSKRDVISGALQYYDVPGTKPPMAVQNLEDPDASVWLRAHVQYWEGDLLARELVAGLPTRRQAVAGVQAGPTAGPV